MSLQNLAARFLRVMGALLVLLGIVHLAATPHIPHLLDGMSTREAYRFARGPTILNHVLVGILLIPLGFTTWLASSRHNVLQSWARQVLIVNAIVFSTTPLSIVAFMRDPAYYEAPLFVSGVAIVVILSVMMIAAVWLMSRSVAGRSGT
jgi:hypothetical protein